MIEQGSFAQQLNRFMEARKAAIDGNQPLPVIIDYVAAPAPKPKASENHLLESMKVIGTGVAIGLIPMIGFAVQNGPEMATAGEFLRESIPTLAYSTALGLVAVSSELAQKKRNLIFPDQKISHAMTWGLIALNALGFVAAQNDQIFGNLTTDGRFLPHQIWRLATSAFVHRDPVNFLTNMGVLYLIGKRVEERYGSLKTLLTYLAGGLAGNTLHALVSPEIPAWGASGGNMGLVGELLAQAAKVKDSKLISALTGVAALSSLPARGISAIGHVAGLVTGVVNGIIPREKKLPEKKFIYV